MGFGPVCRLQLVGAKDSVESLRSMAGDMVSSSDLADLTKSAQAVEERSQELASKQAENLEQVSEELLCSPEIVRYDSQAHRCLWFCEQAGHAKGTHALPCNPMLLLCPLTQPEYYGSCTCEIHAKQLYHATLLITMVPLSPSPSPSGHSPSPRPPFLPQPPQLNAQINLPCNTNCSRDDCIVVLTLW